jgi:exopolysaccharide biosynthesis WecB/TagA/CpsF family protein
MTMLPLAMPRQRTAWVSDFVSSIHLVRDARGEAALFERLQRLDEPLVISFVNAHGFNLAWKDPAFRHALESSYYLLRDGVGMQLFLQFLGVDPGRNMNGTDLIPKILRRVAHRRIAVLGTTHEYALQAAARMKRWGCTPVLVEDGFQPPAIYLRLLDAHPVDVVLLGMGMPKQELLSNQLAQTGRPLLIINGGAILDFIAGRVSRAPAFLQRAGLEWLYRLWHEPRRLWRRYVLGNAVFLARALAIRLSTRVAKPLALSRAALARPRPEGGGAASGAWRLPLPGAPRGAHLRRQVGQPAPPGAPAPEPGDEQRTLFP